MLVCRVANSLFENYENPTIIYDAPYSVLEDLISDDWTGKKMF
jgi:hypothetical protein